MNHPVAAQHLFSLVHPEFYETLSNYSLSPEYVNRLKELLPDEWALQRNDVWVHARRADMRQTAAAIIQGFKIHVSCAPVHALHVLTIVVPVCIQQGTEFKIAGDPTLLHILNSKLQRRGYSGKFMTIYPSDEPHSSGLLSYYIRRPRTKPSRGHIFFRIDG